MPEEMLSPHFSLRELTRSDTADAMGNPNTPTPDHMANMRNALCPGLERIRALPKVGGRPVTVESAYRNPVVNAAVGGVPNSDHALGYAADIQVDGLSDYELACAIRDSDIEFDQLIREDGRTIHVSFHPRMRRQVLRQRGGPGSAVTVGLE